MAVASITDELRNEANKMDWIRSAVLRGIADRIDAAHRAALEKLAASVDDDRDGWIELPKDADGVPIRFKDKVTVPWSDKVYEVGGFSYQENVHTGTMTIWIDTHIDGKYRALCATDSCHHYAPDTWERIIEDALDGYHDTDFDKLVARCKALAGEPTP